MPEFKFSLRAMLMVAFIAAISIGVLLRAISNRARFEIKETHLEETNGFLNGIISYRCSRRDANNNINYSDTHLYVKNVSGSRMGQLKVGDEFFVSYRERDLWPLEKQNRYLIFMTRELGIDEDEIEGFVHMDGWTEVHVRGAVKDAY